ncbi:uncharacterized protein LOC123526321 [Mercenaria mercenaria]|uniref:uncharacterized protein LOC123526321 n=1 Tax=Mercenaria mercenaria TaxID=6596 RepID=UPI00234F09FB|nr:uncharacterized protein LOC123526321 [Mercenaria mercenaria]
MHLPDFFYTVLSCLINLNMATNSNSDKNRELNIFITGEDNKAKCKLGSILTSSVYRLSNHSNPIVRSIWSSYQKNTKLKVIVAPLSDSTKYNDLLNNMKSYRHRYILYVVNSVIDKAEETMKNILHLKSHIGNYKTRYIPVIYRDQERLSEPVTYQEACFLQQFPHTHFHAPLIYERCDQKMSHMILLDYIKHATNRKEPCAFRVYKSDMYLCYDISYALEVSALSEHNASGPSHSTFIPYSPCDAPNSTIKSTVSSDPIKEDETDLDSEICDDDMFIFDEALAFGVTKSHHVRVMVVGPNGGGKTTLIKRLQLERTCCDDRRQPTEGIEIAKAHIRCRLIGENLEWEAENANIDFKRKLLVQKVAVAMKNIEIIESGTDAESSLDTIDDLPSFDGHVSPDDCNQEMLMVALLAKAHLMRCPVRR